MISLEKEGEMIAQALMGEVVIGAYGSLFKRSIHAFYLPIGPWMVGFGEAMFDLVFSASEFKSVSWERFPTLQSYADVRSSGRGVAWSGEVCAIVGEDGMNAVRHRSDELA